MNIVQPYAKLMLINGSHADEQAGIEALRFVEWCGRISHRSEDAQTPESYDRFLRAVVLGHGDWSIVEHVSATVDFLVDRGITHEIVRHRLASYTQESTRFVNYEKKMPASFVQPPMTEAVPPQYFASVIKDMERAYRQLLTWGCAPQIARSVFPNALASRLVMTCNLRNWRHFFIMRTSKGTHPQMRQVTIPLLAEFKRLIPILFEDLEPGIRQADAMRQMR